MARQKLHVGLEIGTTKVAVVIAETGSDGLLRIIGAGEAVSRGVRKGEIVDIGKVALCLTDAVAEAEEKADREIKDVVLSVTGSHIDTLNRRGVVPIAEDRNEIDEEDLYAVEQSALDVSIPAGHAFLHTMIQHYYVDGQKGVDSPIGMVGRKLEAEFHMVHGQKARIHNLTRCIAEANLGANNVVMSAVASAQAVLDPSEKTMGALIIDLGGGTTDYILCLDGSVRQSGVLAVGGDHLTNDISIGLRVTTKWAEKLKTEEADVAPGATAARGLITMDDPTYAGGQVERRILNIVTEARVREIFTILRRRLNFERHAPFVGAGVFLTGGTAELKGIAALASDVFGVPARVAKPRPLPGPSALFESPRFSTAVGLVLYSEAAHAALDEISIFDRLRNKLGRILPGL